MVRPIVNRFSNAEQVANAVAEELFRFVSVSLQEQDRVDIALTGGTVGIASLAAASRQPFEDLDLSRLHIWWGDERFVAQSSDQRNDKQAEQAFLRKLSIPKGNIHAFPAKSEGLSLELATEQFAGIAESDFRNFDLMLMGMGPDGHIASLFPGQESLQAIGLVVAVPNSPKPPEERISFSFDAINRSRQIWFTVAGADKAHAVLSVFEHQEPALPASKIHGREKTVWFIDQTAGNLVWGC